MQWCKKPVILIDKDLEPGGKISNKITETVSGKLDDSDFDSKIDKELEPSGKIGKKIGIGGKSTIPIIAITAVSSAISLGLLTNTIIQGLKKK